MSLTDDQKAAISKWIEAGATLSEIQKRLKEEFQISLTYLETRLLADDLKLAIKEQERPREAPPLPAAEPEKGRPGRQSFRGDRPDHATRCNDQRTGNLF